MPKIPSCWIPTQRILYLNSFGGSLIDSALQPSEVNDEILEVPANLAVSLKLFHKKRDRSTFLEMGQFSFLISYLFCYIYFITLFFSAKDISRKFEKNFDVFSLPFNVS